MTVRNDDGTCAVCGWFNCRHIPVELPLNPADECGAHGLTWCHQCHDPLTHVQEPDQPEPVDCDAHGLTSCLDCGHNVRPELAAVWQDAPNCYGCDGSGWVWSTIAGNAGWWTPCPKCDHSGRWISDSTIEHLQHVQAMYDTGITHPEEPAKHQYVCKDKTGAHNSQNSIVGFRNNAKNILTPPRRPGHLRCKPGGATMLTHTPDGSPKTLPLECGECDACREWRKREIAIRFGLGRESDTITLMRVSNFRLADYDAAAKWVDGMGRRQPGKRWRGLREGEDYYPEVIMCYPGILDEHVLELARLDCARKSLTLTVSVGPMTGDDLYTLLDDKPTRAGPAPDPDTGEMPKHLTSRFVDWPDFADKDNIFLYGEMAVVKGPSSMEQSEPNAFEKHVLKLAPEDAAYECATHWMHGMVIDQEVMHSLADAVQDAEPERVGELVASIRGQVWRDMAGWVGPKELLIESASWMRDPRIETWRDAYAPVLTAAGMHYERKREWAAIDAAPFVQNQGGISTELANVCTPATMMHHPVANLHFGNA